MKIKYHSTAGGVVADAQGRFLVIVRDVERGGKLVHEVRLPKGHIDEGESPEEAALREVGEESGYWGVEIAADLGYARSEFDFKGKHHVRDEQYFLMRLTRGAREAPAPMGKEEALFVPEWLDPAEAERRMTYPTEADFIRRARAKLG